MEISKENSLQTRFRSPNEELYYISDRVNEKEKEVLDAGGFKGKETLIREALLEYEKKPTSDVLHQDFALKPIEINGLVLNLTPEEHDRKIEQLALILMQKGIKNTLSVIEKTGDTHLEDDFHRFLVEYVHQGMDIKGAKRKSALYKTLSMTLYEVVIPDSPNGEKPLREIISGMEQFYAGMLSVSSDGDPKENYLVLEIANSNGSEEFVFYVSVPNTKKSLFEKQILSIFPKAAVTEKNDDYNIFNESGISVASVASHVSNGIFPIKTYENFDHDPFNVILNSFSKINKDGEGASLQVILQPTGNLYSKRYQKSLEKIQNGASVKEALGEGGFSKELFNIFGEVFSPKKKDVLEKKEEQKVVDQSIVERIQKKASSPILLSNIRLVSSANTKERAEEIISDLESAFQQFNDPQSNSLKFNRAKGGRLKALLRDFSFRTFSPTNGITLNLNELTTIIHFHTEAISSGAKLKVLRAISAPSPVDVPQNGTLIGFNNYQGANRKIYITDEDRLRHIYTIGQTGTGKTTLLVNMIIQDIIRGNGVCMIDPHGSDVQRVLANIPKERLDDVIYFDPSYTERPMGLNMLEYDPRFPEQKTFVVNELFSIFQKLYGAVPESMGPMFEQYFRNAAMLVIEDPQTGSTLLDVSRVLSNSEFRNMKLSHCKNPVVVQFWKEVAEKAGGEGALANIVPYITSKFDVFLSNEIMRPIVAQEHSSFNFREIMDNRKILLVNLSKGRLGDINANLIGLILIGKILMAALSRVDLLGGDFPPFYLYIDEFQNITTPSISTILSEARKYKLSLYMAHQFIGQLEEDTKNAIFGNAGTIISFRIGADDAEYIENQFIPVFTKEQLINIDNFNAYIKMLINGRPAQPFNITILPPLEALMQNTNSVKQYSYLKYGRNRAEVESEIMKKYEALKPEMKISL